ncbi:MAG: KilA-N domain-containing protein, partial [Bacteroidales bacterium]|nr:KilA-N domain-containing protein [Bacteroidales bacterium]
MKKVEVEKTIIHITQHNKEDYISLTDMLKHKDSGGLVFKWLSNKNT